MSLDWTILNGLRSLTVCPLLDFWMPKITALGNAGFIWFLAAAALLCTKRYRRQGVVMLAALVVGALAGSAVLKPLIARPRPCWLDTTVPMLVAIPQDYSFPSGHTLISTIGAAMLTHIDRRFGCVAIPLAVLIAFSRMYLFVHFPSDILAGAVIGLAISWLIWTMGEKVFNRVGGKFTA